MGGSRPWEAHEIMGVEVEAGNPTELRRCLKGEQRFNHVIDIASLEELFEHDGPLLAEDCDLYGYHFERDAALVESSPVVQAIDSLGSEQRVEQHVKKVMEQIKARQQDEVLQRFDSAIRTAAHRVELQDTSKAQNSSSDEQLVKDTMVSLQAAQDRMALKMRVSAALQAASERAAATSATPKSASIPEPEVEAPPLASPAPESDELQARIQKAIAAAHNRHASEDSQDVVVPAKQAVAPKKQAVVAPSKTAKVVPAKSSVGALKSVARSQAAETFQDRVDRVLLEAQRRAQDTQGSLGENLEEQTTTASSHSATDSGSDNGADEWQSRLWWTAPR